jgi:hypothetical protein
LSLCPRTKKKKGKMNRNNKRKRDLALSDVIKILMISDPCRKPRRDGKKQKIELSKRYKWNPGPRTSGLCVYFLLLGRAVCCVDALLFMLRLRQSRCQLSSFLQCRSTKHRPLSLLPMV